MAETVAVPLWAFVLGVLVIVWTVVARLLVPGVRWVMRRRLRTVVDELNTRLQFQISAFKLTRRQALIDRLVADASVLAAVDEEALRTGSAKECPFGEGGPDRARDRAILQRLRLFSGGQLSGAADHPPAYRIRLGFADDKGLAAIDPGATVVFVMNHRSNADYLIVAFMAARRTALSYAVGEWAKVWPIQTLVRSLGAYFVRRNSRDALYRRVLARYVQMATQSGVVQAVYPEGGLSRDGHLRPMKLGLISYMVSAFDPVGPRDLVFVPVGINYDRVIEDRTLLRELDPDCGEPSAGLVAETLVRAVVSHLGLMLRRRWYRLGYAVVNFGSPISMRAYCKERGLDFQDMAKPTRMKQVALLGDRIQDAIAADNPGRSCGRSVSGLRHKLRPRPEHARDQVDGAGPDRPLGEERCVRPRSQIGQGLRSQRRPANARAAPLCHRGARTVPRLPVRTRDLAVLRKLNRALPGRQRAHHHK